MIMPPTRRGFFFVTLVILLAMLLFFSTFLYNGAQERKSVQTRVKTMNSFLSSSQQDLQRQVYITSFRTIFVFEKLITSSGSYITNMNDTFREAFFNGTVYGEAQEEMLDATYADFISALQASAARVNINMTLTSPQISIKHDDPWHVNVTLVVNATMEDLSGLARWDTPLSVSALVPVDQFEDPLYTVNTQSKVTRIVTQTPFTVFAQGTDVSNLSAEVTGGYYLSYTGAPSFLDRLEGKLGASPYGIESLVDLQQLSGQGIFVETKSVVDYIYFDDANNPSSHRISGMPTWFRLDTTHLGVYNVSGLAI